MKRLPDTDGKEFNKSNEQLSRKRVRNALDAFRLYDIPKDLLSRVKVYRMKDTLEAYDVISYVRHQYSNYDEIRTREGQKGQFNHPEFHYHVNQKILKHLIALNILRIVE